MGCSRVTLQRAQVQATAVNSRMGPRKSFMTKWALARSKPAPDHRLGRRGTILYRSQLNHLASVLFLSQLVRFRTDPFEAVRDNRLAIVILEEQIWPSPAYDGCRLR